MRRNSSNQLGDDLGTRKGGGGGGQQVVSFWLQLSGGGPPRFYLLSTIYTHQHMLFVDCTCMPFCPLQNKRTMSCVAIVDCTLGSPIASFKDMVTLHRRTGPTK